MSSERATFSAWVHAEIAKRGWKASDLARAANVSKGTISDILNERRRPGLDVCVAIARALKYPPEDVLRIAGLLPPDRDLGDLSIRQLAEVARELTEEERAELLEIALLKLRRREKQGASPPPREGRP